MSRLPAPWPQCRLLSDDNSSKSQCTAATTAICNWVPLRADQLEVLQTPLTISDSEDEEIAKEALEGVDEAAHENGTKGYQDDRM